tara:strand:+ start:227 stop:409 length:183 start_codon:yes stop_codon:yes gene_type:complete
MYIIVSPSLGKPGDEFIPDENLNVHPLLDGGHIEIKSDKAATKSAKTNTTKAPDAPSIEE